MSFAGVARRPRHTERIGVVVVGCGYWGRNYVRVFDELPTAVVVAICDESLDRLQTVGAAFPHVRLTTTLQEALALPGVHAAVVCTPATTHHEVARECLAHGVHVLVEKPMTTRSDDASDLIALADAADVTLMAGHTFVYNAGIQKIKEYVDKGDLGRIYYMYARRTSLGPIRTDVDALWDLAPHDISIFDHLLGVLPERVTAVGAAVLHEDREDVGFVTLTYPGGIVALVHVSWADPHKTREVVVVGSEKRILFNDLDSVERVRIFDKGVTRVMPEAATFGEFSLLLRDGDIMSPMIPPSEPLKEQCQHFLDCVLSGKRPRTDSRAGRNVVRVMEAIDRSIAFNGEPITLHPDEPEVRFARGGAAAAAVR